MRRHRHKAGPATDDRLGTLKIGETLLPITHLRFQGGLLVVTATAPGPFPADYGTSTVFDLDGRFIISNAEPTGFAAVTAGGTLTVVLPVHIAPTLPNLLVSRETSPSSRGRDR